MSERLLILSMQNILREIEEGIHIVNKDGITLVYNEAMERIEGFNEGQVVGKHLLDVFPGWTKENSTLLSAINSKKPVVKQKQNYINLRGKLITTTNITFPIFDGNQVVGAVEVSKNFTNVSNMSEQILKLQEKLIKPQTLGKKSVVHYNFNSLIGGNKKFLEAIKYAKRASQSSSSVLIEGETGTGKELFAQSIHSASIRKDKPFIAQNCAALPENLLEGILFGTSKGSFTGALDRAGLFEQANGGTILLDEINSMSSTLQAKLLRVLQESYVRRIGGNKDIYVDIRIICTTNESLEELVSTKMFRKDLYYRLNVINIRIPTLRERPDDLHILCDYFIRMFNQKLKKDVWMISKELEDLFQNYEWHGNVRELQNVIETAMNMVVDEHVITKEHLPNKWGEMLHNSKVKSNEHDFYDHKDLNQYLENIERSLIRRMYLKNENNITKTAIELNISRQNLQYKLKKYEII